MKQPTPIFRWFTLYLACLLLLSACNFPGRRATPQQDANAIYTAAAETVQAQLTQVQQPPATGAPVQTLATTAVIPTAAQATEITLASATPIPNTQPPAPPTSLPCDLAKFIQDVTIPDNTKIDPGATFTKTWRLQNGGSCTWNAAYGLVFEGENLLNAPAFTPITTGSTPPGATVDITVSLTAPNTGGVYRQNFKLVNASGNKFALGDGSKPFWAQIEVSLPGGIVLDFLTLASQAEWRSGIGNDLNTPIAFNGADEDINGTAKIKDGAKMETGGISGKVLLTFPKHEANSTIAGTYPAYLVQNGDRLRGRLGFLSNPDGSCGAGKAIFQVFYIDGSATKLLAEWNKTCDGSLIPINIDLSSLKGKTVQFILAVRSGTTFQDDWAIWNSVRIER
jgi:hypothetical protein